MTNHITRLFPTARLEVLDHSVQNLEELTPSQVQMLVIGLMLGEHDTEHFPTPLNDQIVVEFAEGGALDKFYQRLGSLFGESLQADFCDIIERLCSHAFTYGYEYGSGLFE